MTRTGEQAPEGNRAARVAAGILLSRVSGLVREAVLAHVFGVGAHLDVFRTALRGPNVLQNLLGEGTVSAAFIPVLSRLVAEGRRREARAFAGAILGLTIAVAAAVSLLGILLAPLVVSLLAPGFLVERGGDVDRYRLAVTAVRWIFPMTGLLVLSAWALGVLNAHRRFFLSYVAPVFWNAAIIGALAFGALRRGVPGDGRGADHLLLLACAGALAGGGLQFLAQLPGALRALGGVRPHWDLASPPVRQALAAVGPAIAGRGVYQLSAWLDLFLASWLVAGAIGALGLAQTLYVLPVSLFAMSVAASELPELARETADGGRFDARVRHSLGRISFLVAPAVTGYLVLGSAVVTLLFRSGAFGPDNVRLVAVVLSGYAVGLVPTTWSRLLQNTFFALGDTRSPARCAVVRLAVSLVVAAPLMLWLDRFAVSSGPLHWGAAGLAGGSAAGALAELLVLRRLLSARRPSLSFPWVRLARHGALAVLAAVPAGIAWHTPGGLPPRPHALVVLLMFAAVYLGGAWLAGVRELHDLVPRRPGRG